MVSNVTVIYCLGEFLCCWHIQIHILLVFGPPEMLMESLLVYLQFNCEYITHVTFTNVTL